MLKPAIVVAVLATTHSVAYPCMNEVMLEGDEAVKTMVQIEGWMDTGQYRSVLSTLDGVVFVERKFAARVRDAQVLIGLRISPGRNAKQAVEYFTARTKHDAKNMKFRAWLAESYTALGKREEALQILTDLQSRDLMPDGFAYVTLAKLSAGTERDTALDSCRKRAKSKSICTLPATTVGRTLPAAPKRTRMRL